MNIRDTFISDPGHILVLIDLSRVEDRIVQMYSGIWAKSPRMIALARSLDIDTHAQNAIAIMRSDRHSDKWIDECHNAYVENLALFQTEAKLFKTYRQKAKKVTHGVQRALGASGLSEQFYIDGFTITPRECQLMINAYLNANPEIRDYYFPYIEELLRRDGQLTNPFNRRIKWQYNRLDNALLRKAYSFLPQSTTADIMNQWGICETDEWLEETGRESYLLAQLHDEVIVSCPYDETYDVVCFIVKSLEREFYIENEPISIPADVSMGKTWGGKVGVDRVFFGGLGCKVMFDKRLQEVINAL